MYKLAKMPAGLTALKPQGIAPAKGTNPTKTSAPAPKNPTIQQWQILRKAVTR